MIDVEVSALGIDIGGRGYLYAAARDVTQRKRTEAQLADHVHRLEAMVAERTAELKVAKDAAESASRAKSAFLANVSHELRTPLHAIMGMNELALRRADDSKQIEHLRTVRMAARNMLSLVENILDMSRMANSPIELEEVDFNLRTLANDLAARQRDRAAAKRVSFDIDLPEALGRRILKGDAKRLAQAIGNLADNAVKFTDQGAVLVQFELIDDEPDDVMLRVEVRDTGIGISGEDQERIFSAFELGDDSPSRIHGGNGLGLPIARWLIETMGGEIGVESLVGMGSTFWLTVRLRAEGGIATTPQAPQAVEDELRERAPGLRILIAEDEPSNQEVARELLNVTGISVDIAANGAWAVEMAKRTVYDIILMDVRMPKLNGIEATRRIRRIPGREGVPILAMTANVEDSVRAECLAAGMTDFVPKPVGADFLFATLLRMLPPDAVEKIVPLEAAVHAAVAPILIRNAPA